MDVVENPVGSSRTGGLNEKSQTTIICNQRVRNIEPSQRRRVWQEVNAVGREISDSAALYTQLPAGVELDAGSVRDAGTVEG